MVVKIPVEAVWVVMLCSVAVGYQRFGGPCCLYLFLLSQCHSLHPEDGGSKVL
jgi:hypothetical protein